MRLRTGAGLTAAVLAAGAIAAPSAMAAPAQIQAGTGGVNTFSLPSYLHEAGTVARFEVVGGGPHNVTATTNGPDGKPLFRTGSYPLGGMAPVPGSQYLPVGTYAFACTVHPVMTSRLEVNTGTPLPRPTVKVKIVSKSLEKVVAQGSVSVKVRLTGGEEASVDLKLGKRVIGSKETSKNVTLVLPLTGRGRNALEAKNRVKLSVEARIRFAAPAKATGTLR